MENYQSSTPTTPQTPNATQPQQATQNSSTGGNPFPTKFATPDQSQQANQSNPTSVQQPDLTSQQVPDAVVAAIPSQNQEQSQNEEPSSNKPTISTKKKAAYFIVGLLFNFVAIIPILLWVSIKVKANKKPRILSFSAGFLFSILLLLVGQYLIAPIIEQQMVKRFPEMGYIPTTLKQDYPNTEFFVAFEQTSKLNDEGSWGMQEKQLTVSMETDRSFSKQDFKDIGIKTCDVLEANNDEYDFVNVHQVSSGGFLFFSYDFSYGGGASCEDWREKSVDDLLIMLPGDMKDSVLNEFN